MKDNNPLICTWTLNPTVIEPWVFGLDVFTNDEIKKIIELGEGGEACTPLSNGKVTHTGLTNDVESDLRSCMLSFFKSDHPDNEWMFRKITDLVKGINDQFFRFDLAEIETLQFTRYSEDTADFYVKHVDQIYKSNRVRKLSFSIQLSDPTDYEGGELKLYFRNTIDIAKKEKGSASFFPSYMLHEVTPVSKGIRYALVGWVSGPPFR
jgi:PKHD-type hydroxylase